MCYNCLRAVAGALAHRLMQCVCVCVRACRRSHSTFCSVIHVDKYYYIKTLCQQCTWQRILPNKIAHSRAHARARSACG